MWWYDSRSVIDFLKLLDNKSVETQYIIIHSMRSVTTEDLLDLRHKCLMYFHMVFWQEGKLKILA